MESSNGFPVNATSMLDNMSICCLDYVHKVITSLVNISWFDWFDSFDDFCFRKTKYEEYLKRHSTEIGSSSASLKSYFNPINKYTKSDHQQRAIRSAVVNVIVECSLPISLVEQPSFRKLLETCNSRYVHSNRWLFRYAISLLRNYALLLLVGWLFIT